MWVPDVHGVLSLKIMDITHTRAALLLDSPPLNNSFSNVKQKQKIKNVKITRMVKLAARRIFSERMLKKEFIRN